MPFFKSSTIIYKLTCKVRARYYVGINFELTTFKTKVEVRKIKIASDL